MSRGLRSKRHLRGQGKLVRSQFNTKKAVEVLGMSNSNLTDSEMFICEWLESPEHKRARLPGSLLYVWEAAQAAEAYHRHRVSPVVLREIAEEICKRLPNSFTLETEKSRTVAVEAILARHLGVKG